MAQTSNLSATLSSTFMPYFDANRSASSSSTNTRQREDFEESDNNNASRPQLAFTSAFGETQHDGCQDLNSSGTFYRIPACVASYPASELPFASEPALETELETELPPLKKLRSSRLGTSDESIFEQVDASEKPRVILINVVKSILTKKDSCVTTTTSPPHSTNVIDPSRGPWHAASHTSTGLVAPVSLASLVDGHSRPLSRRPSSCASATSTHSVKAVRFVSGNGFFPTCEHGGLNVHHQRAEDGTRCCRPAELEGPVAAVMYLTHSAHAYDRSPIVVESLRMPPRRDAEECGRWVMSQNEEAVLEVGCSRRAHNLKSIEKKAEGGLSLTRTRTTSSSEAEERWASFSSELQKHFLQLHDQPESSQHENEDQDQGGQGGDGEDDQATQAADDDDEEEVDDLVGRDGRNGRMLCGLGKWSSGQILEFDDALGGF